VMLVDHQTGHQLAQFEHNGGFNIMKFSPDSRILATTTGGNGDVKLWDAFTGTLMAAPELQATALFFSPDSSRLIAGHPNRETIIADTSDGKRLTAIGEPGGIVSVNIAADKRTFTTFGKDKFFRNWDAISGKELWHKQSDQPKYDNLEISADGRRYVVLSADREHAEIIELHTGQVVSKIPVGLNPRLLLSEDGQRLLIARSHLSNSNDPTHKYSEIELWHIDAGKLLLRKGYEQSFIRSQLIPGNRFAIIANQLSKHEPEGVLHIISADQDNLLWSLPIPAGFSNVLATKPRNDLLIVDTGRTRRLSENRLIYCGRT
jgi:WD40 repeat protein